MIPQTAPLVKTAFASLHSPARDHPDRRSGKSQVPAPASGGVRAAPYPRISGTFWGKNGAYQKAPDLLENPIVLDTVLATLHDPDANARAAALDVLRKVKDVEQRPDFRAALAELQKDSNPRLKLIATSVLDGKKLSDALKDVQPGLGARLQLLRFQDRAHSGHARTRRQGVRVLPRQPRDLQTPAAQLRGRFLRPGQRVELQIRHARGGHQRSQAEPDSDQAHAAHRQRRQRRAIIWPPTTAASAGPAMNQAGNTGRFCNGFAAASFTHRWRRSKLEICLGSAEVRALCAPLRLAAHPQDFMFGWGCAE